MRLESHGATGTGSAALGSTNLCPQCAMEHLYKSYPPHLGHLKIPLDARGATLASLGLYSPCRPRAEWLHRGTRLLVKAFGSHGLPGRTTAWTPPVPASDWRHMKMDWRQAVGPFDDIAIHEQVQPERRGLGLLLIREGAGVGFVRLQRRGGRKLRKEFQVLELVAASRPTTFSAPEPRAVGSRAGWSYLLTTAMPSGSHRVPRDAPIRLLSREISSSLAGIARPADVPVHWEAMHGDLTPWNLRELRRRALFLFDWEDASWGPPGADAVLYEATASALESRPPRWVGEGETVEYWRETLSRRALGTGRDQRLANGLDESLRAMTPRPRRTSVRPRALVFAYACDPSRGSEPGAGWAVVSALGEQADCVVLVGPENDAGLVRWREENQNDSLCFRSIAEPRWAQLAKRHRITWFLLYLAWLRQAGRVARSLVREGDFDLAAHATFSVYWLPTPAGDLGLPLLWGPVGGAVRTPLPLWPALGLRGFVSEVIDYVAVRAAACLPATRRTWRATNAALVQNDSTLDRLPPYLRERSLLLNHVEFAGPREAPERNRITPPEPLIIFAGALERRKGCVLAVDAMKHVSEPAKLVIAGTGPERARLERRARRLGLADRVEFRGHVSREELSSLVASARVAVLPGLREEGGMVLAEVMLAGLPVVTLRHGGPLRVADSSTDARRVRTVPPSTMRWTARKLGDELSTVLAQETLSREPTLHSSAAASVLAEAVTRVLACSTK